MLSSKSFKLVILEHIDRLKDKTYENVANILTCKIKEIRTEVFAHLLTVEQKYQECFGPKIVVLSMSKWEALKCPWRVQWAYKITAKNGARAVWASAFALNGWISNLCRVLFTNMTQFVYICDMSSHTELMNYVWLGSLFLPFRYHLERKEYYVNNATVRNRTKQSLARHLCRCAISALKFCDLTARITDNSAICPNKYLFPNSYLEFRLRTSKVPKYLNE